VLESKTIQGCFGYRQGCGWAGFLKRDVLLCLNHCRSAPLYIPSFPCSRSLYFPPIPRLLAQNLELGLWPGLICLWSTGSGASFDSWLRSCFAPARAQALAQASTFGSGSRFRPPSSLHFESQIACTSQAIASAASSCPTMARAARPHQLSVNTRPPDRFH
jgi:hypothetical protein